MGRPPLNGFAMTGKQRQRQYRARQKEQYISRSIECENATKALRQANDEIHNLQCQMCCDSDTKYNDLLLRFNILKEDYAALIQDNKELQDKYRLLKIEKTRLEELLQTATNKLRDIQNGQSQIEGKDKARLAKLLDQLSSDNENIRATAAKKIDEYRQYIGKYWSDIL